MSYYSTNNRLKKYSFEEALLTGFAPDGGLYFPALFPTFSVEELKDLIDKPLTEVGFKVLKKWLGQEIDNKALENIVKGALNFPISFSKINDYHILELYNGPTLSFKDIAAKIFSAILDYYLSLNNKNVTVLISTTGDAGGAIAQAFTKIKNIRAVVLFPKTKVSMLQEEQITRVGKNITSIEVEGSYEDCRALVKKAFFDKELKYLNLTSANSINIGFLVSQTIYFAYAYSKLWKKLSTGGLQFVIPSGSMGNVVSGLFAQRMGIPIQSIIIVTNENDTLVKYYKRGVFRPKKTITTISNSMDISDPANFIRILEFFNYDYFEFKKLIKAIKINEKEALQTIKDIHNKYNYLIGPHGAAAYAAAEIISNPILTRIIAATSSPYKFASEIHKETGIEISNEEHTNKLNFYEKKKIEMKNDYKTFKNLLTSLRTPSLSKGEAIPLTQSNLTGLPTDR